MWLCEDTGFLSSFNLCLCKKNQKICNLLIINHIFMIL